MVQLRAVVLGSSELRNVAAANDPKIEVAAADLDQLLASDIDVDHVCTPNATHFEIARKALQAGKDVVCEKPLGVGSEQSEQLQGLAEKHGLVATVPFVYRFHPIAREARGLISAGVVVELRSICGHYLQDWMSRPTATNWRREKSTGGPARAFADIGSLLVNLLEFVTSDRVGRLCARTRTAYAGRNEKVVSKEEVVAVLFETCRGVLRTLMVSQVAPGRKDALTFEVNGALQSLPFEPEDPEIHSARVDDAVLKSAAVDTWVSV